MKQKLEAAFSDRMSFVFSGVCAILALSSVHINYYVAEDTFSRTFSDLGKNGFSLSGRTGNFFGVYLLLLPALLFGFYFFYALAVREKKNALTVLSAVTVPVACILPLFSLSKTITGEATLTGASFVPVFFSFVVVTVLTAHLTKDAFPVDAYAFCALAALSVSWTLGMLRDILPFAASYFPVVFAFFYMVCAAFLVLPAGKGEALREKKYTLLSFFISLPTVACLLSEVSRAFVTGGLLLFILVAFGVSFFGRKTVKGVPYAAAALSLAMLAALPDAQVRYWYDHGALFELGNTSVVSETVLAGKLPVVHFFSAHMISDWFSQMIYYAFHRDLTGAVLNVYANLGTVFGILILYFLLRKMIKPSSAYLLTLLLPFFGISSAMPGLGFLAVFALLLLLKKDSFVSCVLFWLALVFVVLFSLDAGLSVSVGCLTALALLLFFRKASVNPKRFALAFAAVAGAGLLVFFAGCVQAGVSFPERFLEFVSVTAGSNSTWAYTQIGDTDTPPAFLVYFFIPVTTVGILVYLLFSVKRLRDEDLMVYIVSVNLCFGQLMALARSMVLYTLGNGVTPRLFPHYALLLACFALFLTKGTALKKTAVFALTFLAVLFMKDALTTGVYPSGQRTAFAVAESAALEKETIAMAAEETERVTVEAAIGCDVEVLREYIDLFLEEDETFVDFANVSGIYGLLGRVRPFYVAQSPSLLTNEFTQRMFISEIERNGKAKLAIFAMDDQGYMHKTIGIPHSMRYYLAAEYLYENYRPLCYVRDYAIWARKDCFADMARTVLLDRLPALSAWYGELETLHTYDYGDYAWLWANRDPKDAWYNPGMCRAEQQPDGSYKLPAFEKEGGYYLSFTANAPGGTVRAVFSDDAGNALCVYTATLREGEHAYLFRCSNDYSWYTVPELSVSFEFTEGGTESEVLILKAED